MAQLFTVNPNLSVSAEGRILVKLLSYTCCKLLDEYTSLCGHQTILSGILFGFDLVVGFKYCIHHNQNPQQHCHPNHLQDHHHDGIILHGVGKVH